MNKPTINILGAGISGLTTAFWLTEEGYNVNIFELKSQPGGAMETLRENDYLVDFGPNSGLETTPLIRKIVKEIGLDNEMVYANENANRRYILRNETLHALPMNPVSFLKTKLFSAKAKARLFKEPFVGKSEDGYYQSISEFVTRRLGKEFLDYAIDPFVAGVFAGDPGNLSVKSAFPKLYRLEEVYGGLIKGMIKGSRERKQRDEHSKQDAKMFTFINGMQTFPKALADKINKVNYNTKIISITKTAGSYELLVNQNGDSKSYKTDLILSTLPAYETGTILNNLDPATAKKLNSIYYPPVLVLYVGYKKENIGRDLDGFGFLIPSKEKKKFLGAIWSSVIFPNRSGENEATFTLFVGGARSPELFNDDEDKLIDEVLKEFTGIMQIKGAPVYLRKKMWKRAIPQYNLGYIEFENAFEEFEKKNPGLFLSGNYRGGISVGDCVKNSELTFKRIDNFIKKKTV